MERKISEEGRGSGKVGTACYAVRAAYQRRNVKCDLRCGARQFRPLVRGRGRRRRGIPTLPRVIHRHLFTLGNNVKKTASHKRSVSFSLGITFK